MSSKGSKAEVSEVGEVLNTDSTEEAPVLDPANEDPNPVFSCPQECCDCFDTPDIHELDTHMWEMHDMAPVETEDGIKYRPNVEPEMTLTKSFPTKAAVAALALRMENVEGYVMAHDEMVDLIPQMADDIAALKVENAALRAELLQSAGYKALLRQIQLARHVIDSHVKAPHRN